VHRGRLVILALTDLRGSLTRTSGRTIAQELLHSAGPVHFTRIEVPFGVTATAWGQWKLPA